MAGLTFEKLQQQMQLEKQRKQGISYPFRNVEDINSRYKEIDSGWELRYEDCDPIVVNGRLFYKSIAIAKKGDEIRTSTGYAELSEVPVITTKTGKTIQQMQVPQWTGAVSSYARKYAVQGLFAIGDKDVDEYPVEENQVDQPRKNQKQSQPAKKQASKTKKDAKTDEANALFAKLKNRGVLDKTIMDYIAQYIAETGKPDEIETKIEAMKELDAKMTEIQGENNA